MDQKFNKIDKLNEAQGEKAEAIETRVNEMDDTIKSLLTRIAQMEEQIQHLKNVEFPEEIRKLSVENEIRKEDHENLKNRQLRRTLVFRNIPETKEYESYQDVKILLAQTVSEHTDIPYQEVYDGIERSHRESKRIDSPREGKRNIFAAFLKIS